MSPPTRALDIGLVGHNVVVGDGEGRALLELARALARRGHGVSVYAQRFDAGASISWRRFPALPGPQIIDDLVLLARATRAVRRARHDVTVAMGPCALPDGPLVYYAEFAQRGWQRSWTAERPRRYHQAYAVASGLSERAVSRRAEQVIACSASVGEEFASLGGRGPSSISVVPNGVDLDRHRIVSATTKAAARRRLGVDPGVFIVAFLGEYHTTRKGLNSLVDAVGGGPPDELLLVAGHGNRRGLEHRVARAGAAGRVRLLGFTEPAGVYAAADVVVVPSVYEPFSLVALEALASGLPVVLSRAVGAADHVGAAALIVEPGDVNGIRLALDRVKAGDAPGPEACREAVAGTLGWPQCAEMAADVVERAARPVAP